MKEKPKYYKNIQKISRHPMFEMLKGVIFILRLFCILLFNKLFYTFYPVI